MTITDTTSAPPDYRALTDDQLADIYQADPSAFDAVAAELDRRDRAARMTKARKRLGEIRGEGDTAAFAQYLEADAACRGTLLSREGIAAGITDEQVLWRLPEEQAQRYASEELRDHWLYVAPRITSGAYVRQQAAEGRAAQSQARHAREEERNRDDELAGNETGALRRESPAPQAPQAGAGGPVRGGGRGPGQGGGEGSGGTGGPGGPVQPGGMPVNPGDGQPAPTFDQVPDDDDSMPDSGTRAVTFDQVEEIDQEWLWPGMIPAGLLTVVFGPPKASKTTLVIDYAARLSRGDVNPDGTSLGLAAPVLMGALEDISESSTVKKLKAAKADLSMVVDISGGPDGDGLELELDHVAWLHEVAAEHPGVALIVIDTLSNSANKSIVTRPGLKAMLKPLAALAANTGAAVILTAHSLKGHDDIPEGGRSLVSIPRMVLQISKSQQEPGVRTLSVHASNVASDSGEGYRYKVIEDGAASRLEWCWDAVRTGPGPEATGQSRILLLLRNSEEPMSAQLIAAKTGINYAVTRVLLSRMKKRGQVAGAEERGTWAAASEPPQLQAV